LDSVLSECLSALSFAPPLSPSKGADAPDVGWTFGSGLTNGLGSGFGSGFGSGLGLSAVVRSLPFCVRLNHAQDVKKIRKITIVIQTYLCLFVFILG
jgi:hypothetical protein